jgi:hypothetical protein
VERDGVAAYLTKLAADLKAEVYRPQPDQARRGVGATDDVSLIDMIKR